jgi:molybdopterin synthase catalytic subunit
VIDARVQATDFEPGRQIQRLEELASGAVASITVAAVADAEITEIFVDHYPALARNALARIAAEAEARFGLDGIILIHRHGTLAAGDRLAFAAAAAPDPRSALDACAHLVEALGRAPFWRKETLADGGSRWR